jgi:hypothetical protein
MATGAEEHPTHPNARWSAANSDRINSKTVVRPAVAAAWPTVPIEMDPDCSTKTSPSGRATIKVVRDPPASIPHKLVEVTWLRDIS